jgi:hypothetical protein
MPDEEMFIDKVFAWFRPCTTDAPGASVDIATNWLQTPQARVRATRLMFNVGTADALIEVATGVVSAIDLPVWATATDAEQYLHGLLDACAHFLGKGSLGEEPPP